MSYEPVLDVPADLIEWLRANGSRRALAGDMLRVIQRKGGLTQKQIDIVRNATQAKG